MPKVLKGGDTPPSSMDSGDADAPEPLQTAAVDGQDSPRPGPAAACLFVLVLDARPATRAVLAAQVALLLPGACHTGSPAAGTDGTDGTAASTDRADGAPASSVAFSPLGLSFSSGPAARLVVRMAGVDIPIPVGWEGVPVADVHPRDVDGDGAAAVPRDRAVARRDVSLPGRVDLGDVALALARCGQLRRVSAPDAPSGHALSGAALTAGVPEMMRPLLPGVQRTAAALVGQAEDALRAGDHALLARVGHTLRGMAANYAMAELAACSAALERSAHGGDVDAAADALAWLRAAVVAQASVAAVTRDVMIAERE